MRYLRTRPRHALFRRHLVVKQPGRHVPISSSEGTHFLVALNDTNALFAHLKAGANPNEVDATGCTPLHVALVLDHLDSVRMLLSFGANANAKVAEPVLNRPSWLRNMESKTSTSRCDFSFGESAAVLVRSAGGFACLKEALPTCFPVQGLWEALMRRPDNFLARLPLLVALWSEGADLTESLDALVCHHKRWMHLGHEEDMLAQARILMQWGARPTARTLALAVAQEGQDALDVADRSLALFKLLLEQDVVELWSTLPEALPGAERLLLHKFLMPESTHPWLAVYQQSRQDRLNRSWPEVPEASATERF